MELKRSLCSIVCLITICIQLNAQIRISGIIKDLNTNEVLVGAHVFEKADNNATLTDNNGYYSITVSPTTSLVFSFVGFNHSEIIINSRNDTIINVQLESCGLLEEIVVKAPKYIQSDISTLTSKEIKNLPSISSRTDVLKSIQFLPGIQSQSEGSSLLLVRGGDTGQNLYLIDNIPLIYVNHLGGYMSVFNPDMINSINIYKGGFPARYGGKISSITDIVQREGNTKDLQGSLSFGLTDMSFGIDGPVKDKSSFIITGRSSFLGLFPLLATKTLPDNFYTLYYGFHDINAKYSWKPNNKNSFHLNFYQGDDYLKYKLKNNELDKNDNAKTQYTWGNWLLSAHWKSFISRKLYASTSLSVTHYRLKNTKEYNIETDSGNTLFNSKLLSSVKDISLFNNWKFQVCKPYSIEFGIHSSYKTNLPNDYQRSDRAEPGIKPTVSFQTSLFIENKIKIGRLMLTNIGLRGGNYISGQFSDFKLEPRLNTSINLNANHSFHLSFIRIYQYSHLLFTTGKISNNEIWIPSDKVIKPGMADQYTAGFKKSFYDEMFTAELNAYYKNMENLSNYKEGYAYLLGDANWHSKVETGGKGVSKGLELYLQKIPGKWGGFISYSWSTTTRNYKHINNGNDFLFDYDRPHCLSTSFNYEINEKWQLNLAWIFQSGIPYTPAVGRRYSIALENDTYYGSGEYEVLIYGKRNSNRLKPYHRLDFSFNYHKETKRGNKAVWTFSVYNAYNRQNPYYYYYNTNDTDEMIPPDYFDEYMPLSLYQVSFLPVIPSFSYKVYFNSNSKKSKKKSNLKFGEKLKKWFYYEN